MRSREEDREYRREYRARKRAEAAATTDATILTMPAPKPATDVADAVKAELDSLAGVAEHPGAAAAAMAMARILDNHADTIHHAAAARALGDILTRYTERAPGATAGNSWPCGSPAASDKVTSRPRYWEVAMTGCQPALEGRLRSVGWRLG